MSRNIERGHILNFDMNLIASNNGQDYRLKKKNNCNFGNLGNVGIFFKSFFKVSLFN